MDSIQTISNVAEAEAGLLFGELLVSKGASVDYRDSVALKALLDASYDGFAGKLNLDW